MGDYRNKFLTKALTHNVSIPLLGVVDHHVDSQFYSHHQENQAAVPVDGGFVRRIIVLVSKVLQLSKEYCTVVRKYVVELLDLFSNGFNLLLG